MSIQLIDKADAKSFLEITDTAFDTLITEIIQDISARMENYLNRKLKSEERTEYFNVGRKNYWVEAYPVTATSSVVDDTTTQVLDTDYFLRADSGLFEFYTETTGSKPNQIAITYTGGYTETDSVLAVPDDLKRACMLQTAFEFRRRRDVGLSSLSLPDGSNSKFSDTEFMPRVVAILKWYRKAPSVW